MLTKLALRNARRSLRDYLIYLMTMVLITAMMFAFNSMIFSDAVLEICTEAGNMYVYPEYDSIRRRVLETGRSYQEIYQKAVEEAWKKKSND